MLLRLQKTKKEFNNCLFFKKQSNYENKKRKRFRKVKSSFWVRFLIKSKKIFEIGA